MEIIHLILGKANPNRMNGVNKVVNSLASYQTEITNNVSVWGVTKDLSKNYPKRNYNTELFKAKPNPFQINASLKKAIINTSNKTVFHLHGGFIPIYFSLAKFLKKHNKKFILTPHGAYNTKALEKSKWIKKIYFNLFEKTLIKNAQTVHLIGQSEVDALNTILPKKNKILIPNGQAPNTQQLQSINSKNEKIVFGFCGRIDIETKGLDLLLNGFNQFLQQHPNKATLRIIGGDGEIETLKKHIKKLNITKSVELTGKKFDTEKMNLISNMDVFFHPSRNEGLPGAVLEAASVAVPCVVSQQSNMKEYIIKHNAGIGLPKNNAQNVGNAMLNLYLKWQKNNINKIGNNAKNMVETEFSWHKIANTFIKEYHKILVH